MYLSVDCHAFSKAFGDFKAMEMIKEAGFDGVDYSFCGRGDEIEILGENFREYAKRLREHLDKISLPCVQAHAPIGFYFDMPRNLSNPKYQKIIRSIEAGAILGAKMIVVHSRYVPESADITAFEENYQYYRELTEYAERFGIKIGVENLLIYDNSLGKYKKSFPATPCEVESIVKAVNSPYVAACVDIGHCALVGTEPEDFINEIDKDILFALHVHDNDYREDLHTIPFEGKINWDRVMESLKEYKGYLNYELPGYFSQLPDDKLFEGLLKAEKTGRELILKTE